MNRAKFIIGLTVVGLLLIGTSIYGAFTKQIRVGKYQTFVNDNTHQGEASVGDRGYMYYTGFAGWPACAVQFSGWYMGQSNWKDENGDTWDVKLTGAAPVTVNEQEVTMPVPDENGAYIKRYMRYRPPVVTVDGFETNDPWPLDWDYVDASKIPGTADVMVTSTVNTDLGVTVTQKILAWNQTNHDDYIIYDWTFTNTGNVDLDPDIELPDQVLDSLYFLRSSRLERWDSEFIYSGRGEYQEDSLRIRYAHPGRRIDGTPTGNGYWDIQPGWLWNPESVGQAILHVDKSATEHTDNWNQPFMTCTENSDLLWIRNDPSQTGPAAWSDVYKVMTQGWDWRHNIPVLDASNNPYPSQTLRPGVHHMRMEDLMVQQGQPYMKNLDWVTYAAAYFWSAGPYRLEPGQSIRIVWADGFGVINPLKNWDVAGKWYNDEAITPPPGGVWDDATETGNLMPPVYAEFPQLYDNDKNTWAKDAWIFTGIDSLMQNLYNAQWNVDHNYNVPIPPPPPDVSVTSQPDLIQIAWDGTQSESVSDFGGYRLYRSEGFRYEGYNVAANPRTTNHGEWKLIKDFPGKSTHSYTDTDVDRGVAYYYYVSAYDDGSDTTPDVDGAGHSLESGRFLNSTGRAAYLKKPPANDLSSVVIVPNPFSIAARNLQYPGEPNKILFLELPSVCTIRIYTESGDLVKTIEHTDEAGASGDEAWGFTNNTYMTTETGQIVVSGLYIANIETPDGKSVNKKFVIVQ